jgi:hypothetical protein
VRPRQRWTNAFSSPRFRCAAPLESGQKQGQCIAASLQAARGLCRLDFFLHRLTKPQIHDLKYGKPILDRVIRPDISLLDATKCVLVSFDSTMRSNVGVGLPIDMLLLPTNHLRADMKFHIDEQDGYWRELSLRWAAGVRRVFAELPPHWYPDSQQ